MPPPEPDPPAHTDRPQTAELLAPHLIREDVRLSASDRPGTFQLVAADPTGGVIRCVRGDPPQRGELVSFSPLGLGFGPVRFVGRTAGRVRIPGGAPGPFFATEWVAITALESASYLIDVLRLIGVKIHAVDLPDALEPGQELIYEPAAQRVRLLSVSPGRDRQPTVDFGDGVADAQLASGPPPGVLVETHRRRDSSWRKRLRLASSARLPAAPARAGTAPGVGPSLGASTVSAGGPRAGAERPARRGPTAPAWSPVAPEERRRAVTEPPVQVRARDGREAPDGSPRKRPTVQETQALFPQGSRWFEKPAGEPRPKPTPRPKVDQPLHPMFRREQFGGAYRTTPRRAPPPEAVLVPPPGKVPGRGAPEPLRSGSPRRTPPPQTPPSGTRSAAARGPARPVTASSGAVGGVPAWSTRTPEFPCDPREGQVEWGTSARPVVCVSVGQGSLIFRLTGRVALPEGAPVRVRIPLAPVADRGVSLEGRIQRASFDREVGATTVRVVLVPRSVSPDYRRFVQYWARKGR